MKESKEVLHKMLNLAKEIEAMESKADKEAADIELQKLAERYRNINKSRDSLIA